jgi:Ca2+-binding RTX toxin-like protein
LDLLIGGLGADSLDAGGGDDILIGGSTVHDSNLAALDAILAKWTSGNAYAPRINNLRQGGGLNGAVVLRVPTDPGAGGPTVFDDAAPDALRGRTGVDWFFATLLSDLLVDRNAGTETLSPN